MRQEEEVLIKQLGMLVSEISENCYCAGWLYGTEYFVPELCKRASETNLDQPWGQGVVSPSLANKLIELSEKLSGWVDIDEKGTNYIKFDPYPIPNKCIKDLDKQLKNINQNDT